MSSVPSEYVPEWKGPIEGYTVNFMSKNLWRIRDTHDHEDAMQEARIVFLRCASTYPILDTAAHFMALYKRALANEMHDLSARASKARMAVSESDLGSDEGSSWTDSLVGDTDNEGVMRTMLRQAPHEVLMVLNLFLNAPSELLELATRTWEDSGRYNSEGERWTEKMLGLNQGTNPIKRTRDYLKSN